MTTSVPDMLAGVYLKIRRADRHLSDLTHATEMAFKTSGYHFALDFDPQTKKHVYTPHNVPAVDPEWSIVAGEILYNLRSALDHLAWQLVILDGGTPGQRTQFPIRESPFDENGQRITPQLRPAISDVKILDALEEVQPYCGPQGEPASFYESPLWRLSKLNNIDKHRLLLVVVCILDLGQMWWPHKPDDPVPRVSISTDPVQNGSPVAWFDFGDNEPPPDFDAHPTLAVAIDEADTPEIHLVPITGALSQLVWWVQHHIVGMRFAQLFP